MGARGRRIGVVGSVGLVALIVAGPISAASTTVPSRLKAIDDYLAAERTAIGIPGLALVVVQGDRIVDLTAQGVADPTGRQITPQTPFLLASTSKAFTAVAVMQQVEAGRLNLDAPVQRYLPWFTVADPAAAARITVRQLLYHTSGLSPISGEAYHDSDDQDAGALEREVRRLATTELVSEPGAAYHYSNSNYDVLGLIVQTLSGEPFSDYVERHIFAPLDMGHSHATVAAAQGDGLASGYDPWFGLAWLPTPVPMPRTGTPSATMFASAEDLGHELIAQLNGGRYGTAQLLSPASIAALQTPGVKIDDFHSYAMGWQARPLWEALDPTTPGTGQAFQLPLLLEHGGSWNNGHTYVGFVPAEHWGFALLVNANDPLGESRLSLLEQNVLRMLNGQDPMPWAPGEEPLQRYGRLIALGLLIAELASLAWSVRLLRRLGRASTPQPRRRRIVLGAGLALSLDSLIIWLTVLYVPDHFETTLSVLLRTPSDLAVLMIPGLVLAAIWGPTRTILLAWRPTGRPPLGKEVGAGKPS